MDINFEELNEAIREAEMAFLDMDLKVSAEVVMPSGWRLGLGKVDGVWALYVEQSTTGRIELLKASLATRVEASQFLLPLKDELGKAAQKAAAAVEVATEQYKTFARDAQEI